MSFIFEWDPNKAEENKRKHGVSFEEASTVFRDLLSLTIDDPIHSNTEERYITIGLSVFGKLLVVVHTNRSDNIRIISSRVASREEREDYEEG